MSQTVNVYQRVHLPVLSTDLVYSHEIDHFSVQNSSFQIPNTGAFLAFASMRLQLDRIHGILLNIQWLSAQNDVYNSTGRQLVLHVAAQRLITRHHMDSYGP